MANFGYQNNYVYGINARIAFAEEQIENGFTPTQYCDSEGFAVVGESFEWQEKMWNEDEQEFQFLWNLHVFTKEDVEELMKDETIFLRADVQ